MKDDKAEKWIDRNSAELTEGDKKRFGFALILMIGIHVAIFYAIISNVSGWWAIGYTPIAIADIMLNKTPGHYVATFLYKYIIPRRWFE